MKRCFLVLTKLQLDVYLSSQSKSCTQSTTYFAYSSAAHSEGGTVTPPPTPAESLVGLPKTEAVD